MTRRALLSLLTLAAADSERLLRVPGKKLISIPPPTNPALCVDINTLRRTWERRLCASILAGARPLQLMYNNVWTAQVETLRHPLPPSEAPAPSKCFWCGTNPAEAAQRHEGPHATWCVHFREEQRGNFFELRTRPQPDERLRWSAIPC